ncbi:MAG: sporulation protein [Oscillospiraceae bacterium]|nr:sporulation protein [Oscillospiraceae bacterium]
MEERGRRLLHRAVEVTDKLDLPTVLAPNLPRMELVGTHSFYMDRHRGVLGYSTEAVDINGGSVIVRLTGRELQLQAMTDEELRITGHIGKVELVE